ncbi:MAG: hypothetical protein K6C10_00985 [Prevotella sp.]|nr:hypothetical protein [Prevotella sp.]
MKNFTIALFAALMLTSVSLRAENWMSRLPDNTYVSVLSIPGAHDAATGSGWEEGMESLGDAFARTQGLTLDSLWSIGIRAFDLRPCVYEEYMNINHGIVPTNVHFEDALRQLRDSLVANPSEFIIIHLLHESDGDQVENAYNERLLEVLNADDLKDYFVSFKRDLKVSEMRGKILLLSRDVYANTPIGGFFRNWTGEANWGKQTQGRIIGPNNAIASLYMQDYSDTHGENGIETKIAAIERLLNFSTTYETKKATSCRWIFNFASAYSKMESVFGYEVSTSEGYRDNATHTHAAILNYLQEHEAGPTGIILMDFAGVEESEGYETRGKELVNALIDNNFRYLDDLAGVDAPMTTEKATAETVFSIDGRQLTSLQQGHVNIVKMDDGRVLKTFIK